MVKPSELSEHSSLLLQALLPRYLDKVWTPAAIVYGIIIWAAVTSRSCANTVLPLSAVTYSFQVLTSSSMCCKHGSCFQTCLISLAIFGQLAFMYYIFCSLFTGSVPSGDRWCVSDPGAAEAGIWPHFLHWQQHSGQTSDGGCSSPPHTSDPGAWRKEPLLYRQELWHQSRLPVPHHSSE